MADTRPYGRAMHDMPVPPYDTPLDPTWQTVATVVLWVAVAWLLVHATRLARRERSPLPVVIVLAVGFGSFIEPLYDMSYHLFWLDHGRQWTLFTAFGLPQPVWVMPAYVMVFGCPALLLYRRLAAGATMAQVFRFGLLFACTTAAFEITAVNIPLYTYYGEAPMRLAGYPLWIAVMEGAQITSFAVLCAVMQLRATRPVHLLALFVVFPANFAFETLGAGFPTIMAINAPDPAGPVMWATACVSIAFAATSLWWTTRLLHVLSPAPAPVGAEAGRTPVTALQAEPV